MYSDEQPHSERTIINDEKRYGPLHGLRVLELGGMVPVPYVGKLLSSFGAEVVKVEPPEGDPARRYGPFPNDEPDPEKSGLFLYLNTDKSSVTLNLRSRGGRRMLDELLPHYDVILDDFVPAVRAELGYDYEAVRRCNTRAISLSITPFGLTGPRAHWKAYEDTISAHSGLTMYSGLPSREPLTYPFFLSEYQAGVAGAVGVMAALHARDRGRQGQHIDLAIVDAIAGYHLGVSLIQYVFGRRTWHRQGRQARGGPYPNVILKCKDGDYRLIAQTKREWKRFLHLMGDPAWGEDPRFQDRLKMNERYGDELDTLVGSWLTSYTKQELFEMCIENAVPFCPLKTIPDVFADPHLAVRGAFVQADHPRAGLLQYLASPFKMRNSVTAIRRTAPLLGADNPRLYENDLGLRNGDLVRLRAMGVI